MKKYRYILLSNDTGERVQLNNAPAGWDAKKTNIVRDLLYFGVLKNISVEFEFVGDGYRFIQDQYLKYGIDADILLRVYRGNKFEIEGKINFERFKDDRANRRFKVDIVQSGFVQAFQNREDVKLNILNGISIDRNPINPAPSRTALIRGKAIQFYSDFGGPIYEAPEVYHHVVPFKVIQNGNPTAQEVSAIELDNTISELYTVENAHYYNNLGATQVIDVSWSINYNLTKKFATFFGGSERNVVTFKFQKFNSDNTVAQTIWTRRFYNTYGNYTDSYSNSISLNDGQYLCFTVERYKFVGGVDVPLTLEEMDQVAVLGNNGGKTEIAYNQMSLTINQASAFPDSTAPVILPHELFTNLIGQITGKDNAVYSEFFGRTELGYAADGAGAYLGITKGDLLRGVPLSETQISCSFRNAFTSYNAVFNLGVTISENSITIEPKEDLFNANIIANIGEVSELMVGPASDFLFNSIKVGYPKNEYEQENGRDEFNTIAQYTNSFKGVKKEFPIVSEFYADGYGIEFARRLSVTTTGTSDSKYDDKIFLVDLINDAGTLKTRRLEGVNLVEGIFSPETAINLHISPGQNLLRWQKYINIPLHRKDKVYYFQSKEKNSFLKLITSTGESFDRQDLSLSNKAYFLPEQKEFSSTLTLEALFAIMDNPLGLVRYTHKGEQFFDYLFEVDAETDKAQSTWRVLSSRPTPVEKNVDPVYGNYLKYGDGAEDFVKFGDGIDDIILYQ